MIARVYRTDSPGKGRRGLRNFAGLIQCRMQLKMRIWLGRKPEPDAPPSSPMSGVRVRGRVAGAHVQAFAKGASERLKRDLNTRLGDPMSTRTPAPRPDKAVLDEAVGWLRVLWTVPIANEDLAAFFRWSRDKPQHRAVYDDLSQRWFDAMRTEPQIPPPDPADVSSQTPRKALWRKAASTRLDPR